MSEPVARYRSIIIRLALMVAGILVAAVLVVGSLALLEQYRQLHTALVTKATTLVQFMAQVAPLGVLSLNFVEMDNNAKKVVLTDDEAVYAIILNEQGIPLVYFFKNHPLVTTEVQSLVKNRKPLAAVGMMKRINGLLEVMAPINAGERRIGSVMMGFSSEKTRRALLMQTMLISVGLAATICFSIALLRMVLQRILHPVQVLTAAANQISTGNLDVVMTGTERSDEFGVLSRAFESMASQLRELIAGLEQREQDLRRLTIFQSTLLDSAAWAIISITPDDGIVSSFNYAAERLLGYTSAEVVGIYTPLLWHDTEEMERRAEQLTEELGEPIKPGYEVFVARARRNLPDENEWTFVHKYGNRIPVLLSVTALRDEDGRVTGFVGLVNDLTERKRAEDELKRHREHLEELVKERTAELTAAKEKAEVANQAKSTFLSSMSHELRTPLNAILGYAQVLKRQVNLNERQQQQLEIIRTSGDHLLTLINDILDMGKIEARKTELEEATFDLPAFIRLVFNISKIQADEKNLAMQYQSLTPLPELVQGDGRKLKQVLLNLLNNAVKYTRHGEITVRASYGWAGDEVFRCEVADTGIGISPDQQGAIFEPFTQLAMEGQVREGTGLGLSISKRLIALMQGKMGVESEPGQGSTFWLEVPLKTVSAGQQAVERLEQAVTGYQGERKTILVVDDNKSNASMLVSMLEPLGFRVVTADNSREGVSRAVELKPHLVLLDLIMPGIDGVTTVQEMKQHRELAATKIVGTSATVTESPRKEEFAAVCDEFVPKPIRLEMLLEKIGTQLGLTWERVSPQLAEEKPAGREEAVEVPPPQDMKALYELAMLGDMGKIREWAADLEGKDEKYSRFAQKLFHLAGGFKAKAILALVKEHLREE